MEGGVILIYVGRLERVKGVQNILRSLAEVKVLIDYHLIVVGDGSYRTDLEKLCEELEIENKVHFLGTRRDVPELLWQSDVFVHLPVWEEGFGITVIEAMAAGCICVVNDHGAMPEIIIDRVNGYIVHNGENLGEILREISVDMIRKPEEIRRIRENAVMRSRDFTIEKYTDELDRLIKEIS